MRAQTRIIFFFFLTSGGDRVITHQTEGVLLLFAFEQKKFVQKIASSTFVSVSKKRIFFSFPLHFLARICAHLRAHAREKVTRIAIIDRPLSMIVGGRVGALFFIVCFLSVYRYKSSVFVSLLPHVADWMNEKSWERTDKGGSSTESFDLRGRVSLLFCVLFFVVVLLHIFSLLHRRRSQRRHVEERAFFGKEFQPFIFWNGIWVPWHRRLGEFFID